MNLNSIYAKLIHPLRLTLFFCSHRKSKWGEMCNPWWWSRIETTQKPAVCSKTNQMWLFDVMLTKMQLVVGRSVEYSLFSSASLLFLYLPADFPPSQQEHYGTISQPALHLWGTNESLARIWPGSGKETMVSGMCEGRKVWWLRLQWATSPDCVTAGDQNPLGSTTEEQLCQVSAGWSGKWRCLTALPSSAQSILSQHGQIREKMLRFILKF